MRNERFLTAWLITTLASAGAVWAGSHFGRFTSPEVKLLIGGTLFFSLFVLGLFFLARTQTKPSQNTTFLGLFLISILVKFSGAVALLFAYQQQSGQIPKAVLGIFILIYVLFLVFETWFMMVLGKQTV